MLFVEEGSVTVVLHIVQVIQTAHLVGPHVMGHLPNHKFDDNIIQLVAVKVKVKVFFGSGPRLLGM